MKTKAEFDDFYNRNLLSRFVEMEEDRQKQLNVFIKRLAIVAIFIPVFTFLAWKFFIGDASQELEISAESLAQILCIYLFFSCFYCSSPISNFVITVKDDLMETFAHFWGDFHYSYMKEIPSELLLKSKIFPQFTSSLGEDYFSGIYNGIKTTIAEESLYKKVRTKNGTTDILVFRGIGILLEMPKKFQGQTIVLKDSGIFNIFKRVKNSERIKLEDPIFERHFEVFADSQIEARFLLTTAFMERILKAKQAFVGKNIQFSFFGNKLLISIETKQNMFEISSLFQRTTNRKMIDQAFAQFSSVMEIIDTLKLNPQLNLKN